MLLMETAQTIEAAKIIFNFRYSDFFFFFFTIAQNGSCIGRTNKAKKKSVGSD